MTESECMSKLLNYNDIEKTNDWSKKIYIEDFVKIRKIASILVVSMIFYTLLEVTIILLEENLNLVFDRINFIIKYW